MPTITLNPTKDTYIEAFRNVSANHGTDSELLYGSTHVSEGNEEYHIYMEFNLSSLPKNIIISTASLKLYAQSSFGSGNFNVLISKIQTNSWSENTLTANNAPNNYGGMTYNAVTISPSISGTWVNIAITGGINPDDRYLGLYLMIGNSNSDYYASISSKENSNTSLRPQLVIDYSYAPPSPPTNLAPFGGNTIDRVQINRLSWLHNPVVSGELQKKFDIQWRPQGTTTWNTITQTTANQYYDIPDNTFPHGNIEWQVRTYDQRDAVSAWSSSAIFLAGDKPAVPIITNPLNNVTITSGNITAQWASDVQLNYELLLLDTSGNILWSDSQLSTNKSKLINYLLANNTSYKIRLRIKNSDGLWSDYSESNISVVYVTPPQPTVTITNDNVRDSITLNIINPAPSGNQPTLLYNNIYRKAIGEISWMRIKTNHPANINYIDYTPQTAVTYQYYVDAIGINMAYISSQVLSTNIIISNSLIALVSDYSQWIELRENPQKHYSKRFERTQQMFAGRRFPVSEYSEHEEQDITLTFDVPNEDILNKVDYILSQQQTILYRDSRGRRIFGTVVGYDMDDIMPEGYTVTFTLSRVDYIEGV